MVKTKTSQNTGQKKESYSKMAFSDHDE